MLRKIFLPAFVYVITIFAITLFYKGDFEGFNWYCFCLVLIVLIASQIINQTISKKDKNK